MTDQQDKTNTVEARYQRAAFLQQAVDDSERVALNTTLFPHWINDDCFWYRRQTQSGVQFRRIDIKTTSNQAAFDHQSLAGALAEASQQIVDADKLPITKVNITLSPLQVTFSAFEKNYRFDADANLCHLEESPSVPKHGIASPDGKTVAFVRDYNLWVQDLATGDERALTQDGEQYYAYASPSMAWGISAENGWHALWSADSKRLFTVQVDNRQVKTRPVVHHVPKDGQLRPTLIESRIAQPGDEHVETNRLVTIECDTGKAQAANYRPIPTNRSGHGLFKDGLAWWSNNNRHAYFVDTERGEKVARVVEFDTHTGATRILFEETSETCIYLSPGKMDDATLWPLPDSNELIWYSERNGWAHLYLYDLQTGELKHPITGGEPLNTWLVREVLHFDPERRELFFQTGGRVAERDPYYLDICRVNIDTGEITALASGDAEYTVLAPKSLQYALFNSIDQDHLVNSTGVSPGGHYVVTTYSRADQLPVSVLLNRNGETLMELEAAEMANMPLHWQWPEPVQLTAADGQTAIYGVVFRPSDFSPDQHYPIIDCSLCTAELSAVPKGSFTNAPLGGLWYLQAAALAELGFIVVMIDGRGTAYRERAFIDASYGWMPSINSAEDRIAGIEQLAARYRYMDLNRIGIMAFNATLGAVYGLLQYPDVYKVGVSHGLSDPQLSSSLMGEYLEGLIPTKGDRKNAEELAVNLQGKLLLLHGMADAMTIPAGTFRIVEALQKANKDFDMLLLPNEGQGAHIGSKYAFRRTWDYFVTHLQGVTPPTEFEISDSGKPKAW